MDMLIEFLLWPIGSVVCDVFSGVWGILERDGKTVEARRLAARGPCAYCRKGAGHFVTCRTCRAPHHRDCTRLNGRCAVYGCANRKFLVPTA